DKSPTGNPPGRKVASLPRQPRVHRILPSELNHRANIWAMKKLDAAWIISVSAVGSLQKKYHPCDIVLVDQFLDRTKRDFEHTFFGRGIVGHIAFADPIAEELRQLLVQAGRDELHGSRSSASKSDGDSHSSSLRKITIHNG